MSSEQKRVVQARQMKRGLAATVALGTALVAAACSTMEKEGPPRAENVFGVTVENRLISFNAGQPARVITNRPIAGLAAGEKILGIDFRVARGQLYALGMTGQLYTIDKLTATATPVGSGIRPTTLAVDDIGFDFNPTVDRIRLVSSGSNNARIHPDTGAIVDSQPDVPELQIDGKLAYAAGDVNAGRTPNVTAAAYTYNKMNEKLTTNYAIDAANSTLVTQGSKEGVMPAVSPNSGQLFTVGKINVGSMNRVSFDIADLNNAAFIAVTGSGRSTTSFYTLDLATGGTLKLGEIGVKEPVVGIAIEP